MDVAINYLAVVACAVVAMALGYVWFGPLFGKQWAGYMGFADDSMAKAKEKGMAFSYGMMAIGALVQAYVLAHFVVYLNVTEWSAALQLGFWLWLGFTATAMLGMVLWEGKPWTLYAITSGFYLVSLELMALILALWR